MAGVGEKRHCAAGDFQELSFLDGAAVPKAFEEQQNRVTKGVVCAH
ncbi:Hypothetical protein AA314_05945 [Archangium gephyra]|uniref:Uncharacterized protein n=1 Tax=Archangium gephyra TaxID=48 RepID=A0AAC8QBI8_9BACT|nr:Hypothetical protein AA314_05945 [Archangium gephyra]